MELEKNVGLRGKKPPLRGSGPVSRQSPSRNLGQLRTGTWLPQCFSSCCRRWLVATASMDHLKYLKQRMKEQERPLLLWGLSSSSRRKKKKEEEKKKKRLPRTASSRSVSGCCLMSTWTRPRLLHTAWSQWMLVHASVPEAFFGRIPHNFYVKVVLALFAQGNLDFVRASGIWHPPVRCL